MVLELNLLDLSALCLLFCKLLEVTYLFEKSGVMSPGFFLIRMKRKTISLVMIIGRMAARFCAEM